MKTLQISDDTAAQLRLECLKLARDFIHYGLADEEVIGLANTLYEHCLQKKLPHIDPS